MQVEIEDGHKDSAVLGLNGGTALTRLGHTQQAGQITAEPRSPAYGMSVAGLGP